MNQRAQALADRIEQGADALAAFVRTLGPAEWKTPVPKDGRSIGVIVHHVASVYPLEIQLAQTLAAGKPIAGVTWDAVHQMNAEHAREHASVEKAEALTFTREKPDEAQPVAAVVEAGK